MSLLFLSQHTFQTTTKFFKGKGLKANASLGQVYDAVTGTGYRAGTEAYRLNKVWDANKDGYIAPGESVQSGSFKKHMKNWFPNGSDSLKLGEALDDIAQSEYKREQELIKRAEEVYKARQNIVVKYMTDAEKMESEHQQRLQEIIEAYTPAGIENQEQLAELEKIKQSYSQKEIERYQQQMTEFANAETLKQVQFQKTILETQKGWLSVTDYAQRYFDLIRQEINLSNQPDDVKNALIQQANMQQGIEQNSQRENVWEQYQARFNKKHDSPYQRDIELLQQARNEMLITEQEYQQQRYRLQYETGMAMYSDLSGSLMGMVNQNSSAYRAMFAVQKAFSVASVLMSSTEAISKAWASAAFPYNLPAVAMATVETGALQAVISAISPSGMAHSGIDNIPKEGTWLLDKGERVLSPRQNADLTQFLRNQNNSESGQNVVVNVVVNTDNSSSVNSNEQFGQAMGEAIKNAVLKIIQQEKRQGGMLA